MSNPLQTPHPSPSYDVLVVGDEVESILTAVSAARAGASVVLARRSTSRLGGLSVRGGLSYMDITPEYVNGLFQEFLERVGFVRVALNPDQANTTLWQMITEAKIPVYSGVNVSIELDAQGFPKHATFQGLTPKASNRESAPLFPEDLKTGTSSNNIPYADTNHTLAAGASLQVRPKVVIDATPDADIARALGIPYITGLGGILGDTQNFLGVSPVFRITGISVEDLQAFEASLRQQPDLPEKLRHALPYHPQALRDEYMTRPTFAPEGMDYLDILNPVIGIDYHQWRHGGAASYADAGIFIDGANISRLSDGSLGFNGLVAQAKALNLNFDDLLALSHGGEIPQPLVAEMASFQQYLRERGGFAKAVIIPPEEMYVRQTVTLLAQENMTAQKAIEGGVSPEKAIGTFSYWLDLRGTLLWRHFPGEELPKPIFNVGLEVALPPFPTRQNIAFVSRSAGYSPIGQGTGRIVQHNALLGEGVGIAAALATQEKKSLHGSATQDMPRIQAILKSRRNGLLPLEGRATWEPAHIAKSALLQQDTAIMEALRGQHCPINQALASR